MRIPAMKGAAVLAARHAPRAALCLVSLVAVGVACSSSGGGGGAGGGTTTKSSTTRTTASSSSGGPSTTSHAGSSSSSTVPCTDGGQCPSGVCNAATGVCVASTCTDHVKNEGETDTDCGGTHCPACAIGLGCVLDSDCATGYCNPKGTTCQVLTLADAQSRPAAIAVAGGMVYWSTYNLSTSQATITRVSSAGGSPAVVLTATEAIVAIAVDDKAVYWETESGTIQAASLSGGVDGGASDAGVPADGGVVPIQVATGAAAMTIDANNLYYVDDLDNLVHRVPKVGGTSVVIGTGPTDGGSSPKSLTVDRASAYLLNVSGELTKVSLVDGGAALLLAGPSGAIGLAVTASTVVWGGNTVHAIQTDGGAAAVVASSPGLAVVADATAVYWTTAGAKVMKWTLSDVPPAALVSAETYTVGIALDDTYVYWTDQTAGTVRRVKK